MGGTPTEGPSPTPLLGPTRTPIGDFPTSTALVQNPNAPRIEFFTTDSPAVAPGDPVTLYWSTRGVTDAAIYQLNRDGERGRVWNVDPDGRLLVQTREADRGQVDFILSIGEGTPDRIEENLSITLACPIPWFFSPSPDSCPDGEAEEVLIIEQDFERGRMIYTDFSGLVYALFNDGFEPAWVAFADIYDPAVHPESEPNFVPPVGFFQPIARLGFVWRGNDTVRSRLGLALNPEVLFEGFVQAAQLPGGAESLYVSSTSGTVLQLLSDGDSWQIITLR